MNSFSIGAQSRGLCKPVGDWTGSCTFRGAATPPGLTCFSVGLSASAALGGVSRVPGSGRGVREGVWGGKGGVGGSNCGRSPKGRGVSLRGRVGRPERTVSICRRAGVGWGGVGGALGDEGLWSPGIKTGRNGEKSTECGPLEFPHPPPVSASLSSLVKLRGNKNTEQSCGVKKIINVEVLSRC